MNLTEAMQSVNMDEIIDSMNVYAFSCLKSVKEKTFNGKQPVDFVGELLLKIIEGKRNWDNAKCSFKEFLFGALRSEISNFFKTKPIKHTPELIEVSTTETSIDIEDKKKQVSDLLKQEGADDDELMVFEYWMDGIYKPSDIAKDLGIDVKEVYKIIKRLERKREKIQSQAINVV